MTAPGRPDSVADVGTDGPIHGVGGTGERHTVLETGPRLALCSLLQGADWVEFATARDLVGIGDSAVSKHSRTLEEAGYLEVRKGSVGRRPRTWLRLTPSGRTALAGHLAWLSGLRHAVDAPDTSS